MDGPDERRDAVVTLVDPRSLAVMTGLPLGPDADIGRIIPHGDHCYLLNVGSWRQPRNGAADIFVLESGTSPPPTPLATAPSPPWGAVDDDALYAHHNPTWNQTNRDPTVAFRDWTWRVARSRTGPCRTAGTPATWRGSKVS